MLKIDKNLIQRTLAGALLVAVIIWAILWNIWSFVIIFSIVTFFSLKEFHKITNTGDINLNTIVAPIGGVILFLTLFISKSGIIPDIESPALWSVYGFYIIILAISELYRKQENPLGNLAYMALGQLYVALPFSLLNDILFYNAAHSPIILLALFITIWCNDTFAYLFGSMFGKHRLFERISPKKSWEGFFGGALGALLSGYLFSLFDPQLSLLQWLIFSEIIVVFGTFGDLMESLIKRKLNIKDSGDAIPGHGGWLDRFDSMLVAAPAIVFFLYLTF